MSFPHLPVTDFEGCTQNFEKLLPILKASEEPGVRGRSRGVEDAGWIAPTLLNSWTNFAEANAKAAYRRIGNVVRLKGLLKGGVSGKEVFLLPAGFRPPEQIDLTGFAGPAAGNERVLYVRVTAAGNVAFFFEGAIEIASISGLTFTID